ncbi:MAG: lipid-binding SYLF domain-containing protein [Acidobacteria bacterium]|nr:lipid-binding SYLF domain-containing protein [Acidobacteriota bacterium]
MFRYGSVALCLVLGTATLEAQSGNQNKEEARLANAGVVMQEILDVPENIPQDLLVKAECVIVIPSVTTVAVGIGGSYGRGAIVCRRSGEGDGSWGAPAMYALDGGSIGLQLGGNASAAAGPKGRSASASTDASLRAEILSYSRSRGLFAGVSLEGTSLRPDNDASQEIYGRKITARNIVTGKRIAVPAAGRHLVDVLERHASRNRSIGTTGR